MAEFEPLYTAAEMKAAEAGHDVRQLMERAGRAVAEETLRRFPDARIITGVCGGGANGGDGRIAIEILGSAGRLAKVAEVGEPVGASDVVIDALFGTGFRGEPRAEAAEAIREINSSPASVVSVDVPSGVDASTGEAPAVAVVADLTVTFHGRKVGLVVAPGSFHAGEVLVADIGLQPEETALRLVTSELLRRVPRRRGGDTKYTAGSVLVVGGSPGLTGAACLAAEAAFRADAGYVAVAAPAESLPVLEVRLLEAVKRPLDEVFDAAEKASAIALGPGLGRTDEARALVGRILSEAKLPVVVDADALFGLEPFERAAPTVLTPHSGELGRLLEVDSSWVDAHRLEAARRAVERFRCIVLLKGSETLVAAPGEPTLVSVGTPRLATAGTGDVLTGIVGAFLAKRMEPQLAAVAAARVHADAALAAPHGSGLIAGDVIAQLPRALDAPV